MADTAPQTVHVIDPYGTLGTMNADEAQSAIQNSGFKIASPEQVQGELDKQTYGTGFGSAAKATALGAARSATFGLSDEFLAHSGAMKPEEIAKYKQYRPGYTGLGEVGGILGAIAAPETGILGALSAPVRGVSELGGAATEAASAALPEATNTVGKILSQAGAHAAGSAVEGAAYGLGQSVSENALGDPDLNAEKVMSNVGIGAVTGGALGTLFGGLKGGIQAKFPNFLSEVDKQAIDAGDFGAMAKASDLSEPEKDGFIKGLTKLKPDAGEIKEAAAALGDAPVLPGMISDSEAVRKGQSALLEGPPSYPALKAQQMAAQGFEKAGNAVETALGDTTELTKASLGDTLKDMVSQSVEKQAEPINALYDELKSRYETIPASDRAIKAIARNIRNLEDVPLSPQAKSIAESVAERVENIKTVDDVKRLRSIINQELNPATATPIQKRMTAIIGDKLSNLEENSVVRFAENEMKTSVAKEKIMQLLDQREAANAQYSVFKDKLQRMGEVLGRKRVHGAQDFLDFVDSLTPEKMADKLTGKNNSEFLDWFSKEFPQGMDAISKYQKGLIKEAAMKNGEFDIKRALSEVDKLPKEYQGKIFSPEESQRMGYAKKYIQAFPKNFNPSNTSNASAFRHFFEGPVSAAVGNVRDLAIEKFINAAASSQDETGKIVSGLSQIERSAIKTTKSINNGATAIFSSKSVGSPVGGLFATSNQERRNSHDKIAPQLSEMTTNPQKLIDKLQDSTEAVSQFAPKTAQGLQNTMTKATQFLQSKLPGNGIPQKPLSPKYQPSDTELAKWHKYFSIVEDPTQALKQVASGTLGKETMETLNAVYPKMLAEMQSAVMDKMTDHMGKDKPLPYSKKMALSLFLGQDLVNSLDSTSILANQNVLATATQAKAAQQNAQMGRVNQKGLGKINKADQTLTAAQASAQRKEA